MKGLDEVVRLKKVHRRWVFLNAFFGTLPLFAIVNRFNPMLTDGYGRDLLPSLLPVPVAARYNLILAAALTALALSEFLRRRFHKRHQADLEL
jgi:hypothetical protein